MDKKRYNKIIKLVKEHDKWRKSCLNLVAAENIPSPQIRDFALSDLAGRYGDYLGRDLEKRKYYGTKFVVEIEKEVENIAKDLFHTNYIEFRCLSGHIAGASIIMGLTRPGDTVFELGSNGGGHRLSEKLTNAQLIDLKVKFFPVDWKLYNIDVAKTAVLLDKFRPSLVILGSSNFLFPHPVQEIATILKRLKTRTALAYDASHVLGLIAGGQFQDPLKEGADLFFGSTHKTFPGPQGGLICSNNRRIMEAVSKACYPALVTNHHLYRSPGLAVGLIEMQKFGKSYSNAIIKNAKSLASALDSNGLKIVGASRGYTQSHTILVQTNEFGSSQDIAKRLELCNVILNSVSLPKECGGEGLRLGVQELSRRGADEAFMQEAAILIAKIVKSQMKITEGRKRVEKLVETLGKPKYMF